MLEFRQKKDRAGKGGGKRILIKINVVGSAGPLRFVVNEEEAVTAVIETALKSYAREGRLPVLGTKFDDFILYTPIAGTEALGPWEMIGSFGDRTSCYGRNLRRRRVWRRLLGRGPAGGSHGLINHLV